MKPNIGALDSNLRVILGLALIGFGLFFQSWWGALGIVPLVTGLIRFCPLYPLLHVNTIDRRDP